MEIDFLQNTFMLYIVSSMLVTWVTLSNSRSYRNGSRMDRLKETSFCCALTGAISVPLVDYFTTVPSSISLLIGALVGILGYNGITNILNKLIEMFINLIPSSLSGIFSAPTNYRTGIFSHRKDSDNDDDEPPPVRRSSRDARK